MTAKILAGVALLAMCEDVEIMRQIVDRSVGELYRGRAAIRFLSKEVRPADHYATWHSNAPDSTGVYLPGYGVLIQLAAPTPPPQSSQTELEFGSVSLWEATRRELRGEASRRQVKPAAASDSAHPPTRDDITRRVLQALAENGHNFRELPAGERVTVDIAFRSRKSTRFASGFQAYPASSGYQGAVLGLAGSYSWNGLTEQAKSADENAGDLHMRQKNYAKAVEAYQKALKVTQTDVEVNDFQIRDKNRQALYKKLAQAHVGAGQYKDAERLLGFLDERVTLRDGTLRIAEQSKQANASLVPAAALPAHLIVSATKAQLDAVEAGKMSREEFAKAAQIEYLDPRQAAAEGKSEESAPSE